ncbi:MAG: hypothetical protein WCF77_01655 [Minisyncoccia bacterium]
MEKVECACGAPINEPTNLSLEQRKQCPKCGSRNRKFFKEMSVTMRTHTSVGMKAKDSAGTMILEGFSGGDLHRKSGQWMKKERVIDHKNDCYKETVVNPETGTIIHHNEEPLSEHRGHGDDKIEKKSK